MGPVLVVEVVEEVEEVGLAVVLEVLVGVEEWLVVLLEVQGGI